jgi:hypothetical protein
MFWINFSVFFIANYLLINLQNNHYFIRCQYHIKINVGLSGARRQRVITPMKEKLKFIV